MKVTRVSATSEVHRREKPMQDAIQWLDTRGTCSITIETDQGVSGSSDIYFGRGAASPGVLAKLVNEELAPAVVGEDPFLIGELGAAMVRGYQGDGLSDPTDQPDPSLV